MYEREIVAALQQKIKNQQAEIDELNLRLYNAMPSFDRKKHMRCQANTIFELTKGFVAEPTDESMKSALEMAGYVKELTNDVLS